MSVPRKHFDAIVVGSGASGSIAVKELTERGLDVLLLEAGRNVTEADFTPPPETQPQATGIEMLPRMRAALHGQHMQARRAFFASKSGDFLVNDRENPYTSPRDAYYLWIRGRVLGGRLHTYGRMLLRMSDYDFKGASRDGQGIDWPISYDDLAPYYNRVEEFIGIYGQTDGLPQLPDGHYVGTSQLLPLEQDFKAKVQRAWPERKVVAWRFAAPNLHRVPLGILAARQTGRLTEQTDAVVSRVTVDPHSKQADGVVYVDRLSKQEHRATGDVVVLCASAIESNRLLLNSACASHPAGLGNGSGMLGRYFMDQAPSLTWGWDPRTNGFELDDSAPFDAVYPTPGGVYIPRYHNLDGAASADFARGIAFQGAIGRFPVPENHPAGFGLMGYGEMLPQYENRVTVNRRRRDAWKIPVARIRCAPSENERRLMRQMVHDAVEMAHEGGYRLNFSGSPLGLATKPDFPDESLISRLAFRAGFRRTVAMGAAIHECGGVRMGSDPAQSVLNEYNQCWDIPNLFVTDGSCFASVGLVGPTLTLMALTARACEFIAQEHATGALHRSVA